MAATNPYLRHLMTAAVALPGISAAATPIDKGDVVVDFKYVHYDEQDDLMTVDAEYLSLGIPLTDRNDLTIAIEFETMSGASPMFMSPGQNGEPVVIKSGASITDQRTAVAVSYRHFFDAGTLTIAPSWSNEDDYTSQALTLQYEWDTNNKNTTFAVGAGVASDEVWAEGQVNRNDKNGKSVFFGVTQVLDARSLLQLNVSIAEETGYLSDPYKLVQVQTSILPDSRPGDRIQIAGLARYIRHMGDDASVHLTYRLFNDDWDVQSHTFEASWYQELSGDWTVTPSVRYYTQEKADFYEPYFVAIRSDGYYTSDFRLASFGSVIAGVKIGKKIAANTGLDLNLQYYSRRGDLKLGGEHSLDPEPLSSYLVTLGIKHTF